MTVVIAQQPLGPGLHQSAPAPSTLLPNGTITATAIMDAADQSDSTISMTVGVQFNDNANAGPNDPNWYQLSTDWTGGLNVKTGLPQPPPSVNWSTTTVAAKLTRAFVSLNIAPGRTINLGLDVTVA